jgi:hypothetical protein
MSELILSSDTINEGRVKINNAYSATTNLWSASTGSNSIIADNSTGNLVESTYSSILGGTGNLISGSTQYSAIVGGQNNTINPPSSGVDFNSAIIGGKNTVLSGLSYSVSLGGDSITSSIGDRSTMVQGLKTTKSRVRNSRVVPTILGYNTTGQDENILGDDDIIFVEINVPGATPAPAPTDYALDIGSFLNSKSGRTVEMRVTAFNGGRLFIGAVGGGKGSAGFQINDNPLDDSFWVRATNTLSYVNILHGGENASGAKQIYIYGIV